MTKLRYCTTERQVTSGKEHMHLILKTKECKHRRFFSKEITKIRLHMWALNAKPN